MLNTDLQTIAWTRIVQPGSLALSLCALIGLLHWRRGLLDRADLVTGAVLTLLVVVFAYALERRRVRKLRRHREYG